MLHVIYHLSFGKHPLDLSLPILSFGPDGSIGQDDTAVLERTGVQLQKPPRYAVLLLNDDYTPMEFVVAILRQVFNRSEEEAIAIMLKVHHEGRGVCGVYTQDIAQTRVAQVAALAEKFQHPLQCIAEPVDDA